jgi:hypothetical protein
MRTKRPSGKREWQFLGGELGARICPVTNPRKEKIKVTELLKRVKQTLEHYDSSDAPFSEFKVSEALRKLLKDDNETPVPLEWQAEFLAFRFREGCREEDHNRGTYYGPMMSWVEDGNKRESPSRPQKICLVIIPHSSARTFEPIWPRIENSPQKDSRISGFS